MSIFESRRLAVSAVTAVCAVAAVFMQYSRTLSVSGVNPNIILVFLIVIPFFRFGILRFSVFSFFTAAFSLLFFQYWFFETVILAVIAAVAICARKFLTGNNALDFAVLISISTIAVGIIFPLVSGSGPIFSSVAPEVLYNILLGCVIIPFYGQSTSHDRKYFSRPSS